MNFTPNWASKIIDCDTSILDIPAAHLALRALETSVTGMLYPPILTYKEVALSGGAIFPAIAFINGYQLRFPNAGTYTISGGNFSAPIVAVAGVYVERQSSSAYAVTAVGGSAVLTPQQAQMLADLAKIHGLVSGSPLVVTPTTRSAGSVVQTIVQNDANTVTISV
jgi:hypothetical protein